MTKLNYDWMPRVRPDVLKDLEQPPKEVQGGELTKKERHYAHMQDRIKAEQASQQESKGRV